MKTIYIKGTWDILRAPLKIDELKTGTSYYSLAEFAQHEGRPVSRFSLDDVWFIKGLELTTSSVKDLDDALAQLPNAEYSLFTHDEVLVELAKAEWCEDE